MDLAKMIAELQEERHRLDEAIDALERLSAGQSPRRVRAMRSTKEFVENPDSDSSSTGSNDSAGRRETRGESRPAKTKNSST